MGLCFICDSKLHGERTRLCSSITPFTNVPYPEKIAELLGEEFVILVTPADHLCKHCSSIFLHMDKLENDINQMKNSMLSHIQKKYGLLPMDHSVKTLDVVNGNIKTDKLGVGQKIVPNVSMRGNNVNPLANTSRLQSNSTSKIKIYKCGFCSFQSKDLGHVRFHMRSHVNKKEEAEQTNKVNPTVMKTTNSQGIPQQKKRLFRCQVCSFSFDNKTDCLKHIHVAHNNPNTTTAHEEKKTEEMSQVFQPEIMKTDSNQLTQFNMDINQSQPDNNSAYNMLLDNNISSEGTTTDIQVGPQNTVQEMPEGIIHVNQIIPNNINGVNLEMNCEDNNTGDLDIESMLAAIHNDTS